MLYDATTCIGCKACVSACTTANGLIPDTTLSGGLWQMPTDLNAQTKNIINLYQKRKAKAKTQKEKIASQNRLKFGRTKQEKLKEKLEAEKLSRHLESHKIGKDEEE